MTVRRLSTSIHWPFFKFGFNSPSYYFARFRFFVFGCSVPPAPPARPAHPTLWFQHLTPIWKKTPLPMLSTWKKNPKIGPCMKKIVFSGFWLLAGNFIHIGNGHDFWMGGHRENKYFFLCRGVGENAGPRGPKWKIAQHSVSAGNAKNIGLGYPRAIGRGGGHGADN